MVYQLLIPSRPFFIRCEFESRVSGIVELISGLERAAVQVNALAFELWATGSFAQHSHLTSFSAALQCSDEYDCSQPQTQVLHFD